MTSPLIVTPLASASSRASLTSRPALLVPSPDTSMVRRAPPHRAFFLCAPGNLIGPPISGRGAEERRAPPLSPPDCFAPAASWIRAPPRPPPFHPGPPP